MLLVDVCCGIGGASQGYAIAGWDVMGIDIVPQRNYPFPLLVTDMQSGMAWDAMKRADAVHFSPPCPRWSQGSHIRGSHHTQDDSAHPDLIIVSRLMGELLNVPYVIENVPNAPLVDPLTLCGTQFGLRANGRWLKRHRLFESNVALLTPAEPCTCRYKYCGVVAGRNGYWDQQYPSGTYYYGLRNGRLAMGIPWARAYFELKDAIPPAYTAFIGHQLRTFLVNETPERMTGV